MMKFLRTQMKWIMAIIVVAFLLSTFLMYEGRGTRRTPGRNPDGTMTDYEVAQINGRSLMRSELEQRLRNYLSQYSTRSMASIDMPAIYRSVLDQAILESQLAKEVEDKGIRVSDAEAEIAMKNYADTYFPTREAFYQVLANSGIKVDDYKKSLARQMASERLIRDAVGEVTISDDKVSEFYDTMKAILYSQPEGFMVHMADFGTSADAEYFRAEIAGGASWDVLASGELASHDVINITKSPVRLPASTFRSGILSVLASVDVGTVSPVFAVSSKDYGVALKVSHVDAGNIPYDEVSGDIRTLLTQQEERSRLTAYEESLRSKANVVINDNELFASPVVSGDNTQSADILPIMTLDDASKDESAETPATVASADEPAETSAPVTSVDENPAETPTPVASVDEKPAETPATVTSVDVKLTETPAPVASADEKPAETPATVTSVDVKLTETPAPVASADVKPSETPESVASVDEKPAETPEPVASTDVITETPATESADAVTEAKPEVSQDISADKE